MTKIVSFLILVMLSSFASAVDCENPSTTVEMNKCGEIKLKKVNGELNRVYQRALNKVAALAKNSKVADKYKLKLRLIEAQQHWVKFRQADCDATYLLWSEGSIVGQMYLGCMIGKTEQRIEELKQYAAYDESPESQLIGNPN